LIDVSNQPKLSEATKQLFVQRHARFNLHSHRAIERRFSSTNFMQSALSVFARMKRLWRTPHKVLFVMIQRIRVNLHSNLAEIVKTLDRTDHQLILRGWISCKGELCRKANNQEEEDERTKHGYLR
jgi:hypothetical protein